LPSKSQKIHEQVRSQRDSGLPERRTQCEMAERSFTSSFTTDFCATVLSNVEGRDDTIATLNAGRINSGDEHRLTSNEAQYSVISTCSSPQHEVWEEGPDLFNNGDCQRNAHAQ
jgi:hypothetical protein